MNGQLKRDRTINIGTIGHVAYVYGQREWLGFKSDMVQPWKIDDSQGDFRSAGWFIKTHGEDQQLTASRRFDSRTNWRGILRQLIPFEYSLACCFADTDVSSWTLESR